MVDIGLALAEYASNEKADLQMDTTDEDFDSNSDEELHTLLSSKYEQRPSSDLDIGNLKRSLVSFTFFESHFTPLNNQFCLFYRQERKRRLVGLGCLNPTLL